MRSVPSNRNLNPSSVPVWLVLRQPVWCIHTLLYEPGASGASAGGGLFVNLPCKRMVAEGVCWQLLQLSGLAAAVHDVGGTI